jgi:Tol biopolymer transport system component
VVYNRERTRAIVLRNGDLFERDLKTGALVQITRGNGTPSSAPQYSADGRAMQFRIGDDWYSWNRADRLVAPVAVPRAAKDPARVQEADALRDMQLRLIATSSARRTSATPPARAPRKSAAPTRPAPPPDLPGRQGHHRSSALSPDGRWLLVVTGPKDGDKGRVGKMPRYVTESATKNSRTTAPASAATCRSPHGLKLVDLARAKCRTCRSTPCPASRRSAGRPARRAQARSAQGQPPGA